MSIHPTKNVENPINKKNKIPSKSMTFSTKQHDVYNRVATSEVRRNVSVAVMTDNDSANRFKCNVAMNLGKEWIFLRKDFTKRTRF